MNKDRDAEYGDRGEQHQQVTRVLKEEKGRAHGYEDGGSGEGGGKGKKRI